MLKHLRLALMLTLLLAQPARADEFAVAARTMPPAFGLRENYGADITAFYKWNRLTARMDADASIQQPWIDHADLAFLPLPRQVEAVNDIVNSYPNISDDDNWGQSDYWETPAEFFAKGGDCEDYAIAKYAWLRYLGVPEDSLRLAMVYDRAKKETHMLLIVYTGDGQPLFLDNQVKTVRTRNDFARYWPLYEINRHGWWMIEPIGKGRRIVQAVLAATPVSAGR